MNLSVEPNPRVTFKIHFLDESLLIIEKPSGLVTMPGKGHTHDTLLNGLFVERSGILQNMGKDRSFGLVHRLDKDTSGLLIVAKKPHIHAAMIEQFRAHKVQKFYWAICHKAPEQKSGVIKLALSETHGGMGHSDAVRKAHIHKEGKAAVTAYRVIDSSELGALIEARPVTGRLHQIRVHLDAIGSAILGDSFYGPMHTRNAAPRLALHAHRLILTHPETGELLDLHTKWPADLRHLLRTMALARPDLPAGK